MQKKIKKTFLSGSMKKRRSMKNFCEENYGSDQNSPILTITVCKKERIIKILKQYNNSLS